MAEHVTGGTAAPEGVGDPETKEDEPVGVVGADEGAEVTVTVPGGPEDQARARPKHLAYATYDFDEVTVEAPGAAAGSRKATLADALAPATVVVSGRCQDRVDRVAVLGIPVPPDQLAAELAEGFGEGAADLTVTACRTGGSSLGALGFPEAMALYSTPAELNLLARYAVAHSLTETELAAAGAYARASGDQSARSFLNAMDQVRDLGYETFDPQPVEGRDLSPEEAFALHSLGREGGVGEGDLAEHVDFHRLGEEAGAGGWFGSSGWLDVGETDVDERKWDREGVKGRMDEMLKEVGASGKTIRISRKQLFDDIESAIGYDARGALSRGEATIQDLSKIWTLSRPNLCDQAAARTYLEHMAKVEGKRDALAVMNVLGQNEAISHVDLSGEADPVCGLGRHVVRTEGARAAFETCPDAFDLKGLGEDLASGRGTIAGGAFVPNVPEHGSFEPARRSVSEMEREVSSREGAREGSSAAEATHDAARSAEGRDREAGGPIADERGVS